jgi:hypothetical protein
LEQGQSSSVGWTTSPCVLHSPICFPFENLNNASSERTVVTKKSISKKIGRHFLERLFIVMDSIFEYVQWQCWSLRGGDGGLGRLLPKITARVSLVVETIDSFLYLPVDVVSGWRHFRLRQTGLRFIYT